MYLGGGIVARADGAVSYDNETQNQSKCCLLKHVNVNEIGIKKKCWSAFKILIYFL